MERASWLCLPSEGRMFMLAREEIRRNGCAARRTAKITARPRHRKESALGREPCGGIAHESYSARLAATLDAVSSPANRCFEGRRKGASQKTLFRDFRDPSDSRIAIHCCGPRLGQRPWGADRRGEDAARD